MSDFVSAIWRACGDQSSDASVMPHVDIHGHASLRSVFAVSDLAAASVACAGAAAAEFIHARFGKTPSVQVDRRLASLWFSSTVVPQGWTLGADRDPVTGDFATRDGWIRLHANAHHHRDAALKVLQATNDPADIRAAVARWTGEDLEQAIVAQGGCAARMRSTLEWAAHPQGRALVGQPLVEHLNRQPLSERPLARFARAQPDRPLAGVKVLDLTRVLAGPACTRFLAGLGADVLRIDPAWWQEPGLEPETTLGKHCATLDLRDPQGLAQLRELIAQADILIHGWRPGAMPGLGLDDAARQALNPHLVDVCLNAYGWTGPWQGRRGFDSLVQMSTGIAQEGMQDAGADHPVPLPVQALDHATGYIVACTALRGLTRLLATGTPTTARASLIQTAGLLMTGPRGLTSDTIAPPHAGDYADETELTTWGPAKRMKPPVLIEGAPLRWRCGARRFRTDPARWDEE